MSSKMALGIGFTLASVLVGGWKSAIPGLDFAQASRGGTNPIAEAAAFSQAAGGLAAYQRLSGTYAGAELSPTLPVKLAWAHEALYCLQGTATHLVGPYGVPQPGPCPAG